MNIKIHIIFSDVVHAFIAKVVVQTLLVILRKPLSYLVT